MNVQSLYETLREQFGARSDPATWWPIFYSRTSPPAFERVITNVLVQNSNWRAVPIAVHALDAENLLTAQGLAAVDASRIVACIKPTGLQVQKASRLKKLCQHVLDDFGTEGSFCEGATRDYLLGIGGIGPETADRVLLYACSRLAWPVDTYCLRVFAHYDLLECVPTTTAQRRATCDVIKRLVAEGLPHGVEDWQRLHALMQLEGERLRGSGSSG